MMFLLENLQYADEYTFLHSYMNIFIIRIFQFLYLQSKSQKFTYTCKEHIQHIMAVLSFNEVSFSCDGMSGTHTPC